MNSAGANRNPDVRIDNESSKVQLLILSRYGKENEYLKIVCT